MNTQNIEMQKVTVHLPSDDLNYAKEQTGLGTTELLRILLSQYKQKQVQLNFLKLKGTMNSDLTVEEMRSWEDEGKDYDDYLRRFKRSHSVSEQ
jgi:hypothetical protein